MGSVLALGAYLKNAACLRRASGRVHWSPLHGDLGTPEACAALERSADELLALAGGRVDALAHDLHPDFHSTRLAWALAERLQVPAIGVQHHHAHIGVLMAEQEIDEPVIGLALDGVGLGSDGTAWGGEVLRVDAAGFERVGHLQPLRLPGGDVAAREPWRVAAAVLHGMGRGEEVEARFAARVGTERARGVARLLARDLNCPVTSSAGRWFDAAAAALGLSVRQSHEAEAAMALEAQAGAWLALHPMPDPAVLADLVALESGVIRMEPLLARLFELGDHGGTAQGAALFHAVLAESLAQAARGAAVRAGAGTVALGGGCFLNRLLTARLRARLHDFGLQTLLPQTVGCGDAGLALGQAWVAAMLLARRTPQAAGATLQPKPRQVAAAAPVAAAVTAPPTASSGLPSPTTNPEPELRPCA
ncbi:MAG: carbamoyltransferase HypF [Pseudomonadota bacterium]|jgi:hydrogenase maturation protein HypF